MATSQLESEIVEDEAAPAPALNAPRLAKRAFILVGAVVALLLIGTGIFFAVTHLRGGTSAPAERRDVDVVYIDAPAMVVNLRGADGAARFLKIRFTLVPASAAAGEKIEKKLPLIVDSFQPFLRELRPEDLAGSAAVFRIKEEMLVRATAAVGSDVVKDILIQDLIQQ